MSARTYLALLAIAVVAAFGLAACGGGDDDENAESPAPAGQTGDTGEMTDDMSEMSDLTVASPAADLRSSLDTLLGEHALLAMLATQKGYGGEADFEAIGAALDENRSSSRKRSAPSPATRPPSSS